MNFEQYLSESYLTEGEVFDLFKKIKERVYSLSDEDKKEIVNTMKEYIRNNFRKVVSIVKNFFKNNDEKKYGFSMNKLEALKESLYLSEFEFHGREAGGGVLLGLAILVLTIFINLQWTKHDQVKIDNQKATSSFTTNRVIIDDAVKTLKRDPSKLFRMLHDEASESRVPFKAKIKSDIKMFGSDKTGYLINPSKIVPEDMARAK